MKKLIFLLLLSNTFLTSCEDLNLSQSPTYFNAKKPPLTEEERKKRKAKCDKKRYDRTKREKAEKLRQEEETRKRQEEATEKAEKEAAERKKAGCKIEFLLN